LPAASPEDVVLNEEGVAAGLEYKVLHEGLRDVVISLNTLWVSVRRKQRSSRDLVKAPDVSVVNMELTVLDPSQVIISHFFVRLSLKA
jgi:hypothetical protein